MLNQTYVLSYPIILFHVVFCKAYDEASWLAKESSIISLHTKLLFPSPFFIAYFFFFVVFLSLVMVSDGSCLHFHISPCAFHIFYFIWIISFMLILLWVCCIICTLACCNASFEVCFFGPTFVIGLVGAQIDYTWLWQIWVS